MVQYVCGYKFLEDCYERSYSILLVEFPTVKSLVDLQPSCRYRFTSLKGYPQYAQNLNKEECEILSPVEHIIDFQFRNKSHYNETFDSLTDCAVFFKRLVKDEKDFLRKDAFNRLVRDTDLPFILYPRAIGIISKNYNVDIFNNDGEWCYRFPSDENIYVLKSGATKEGV